MLKLLKTGFKLRICGATFFCQLLPQPKSQKVSIAVWLCRIIPPPFVSKVTEEEGCEDVIRIGILFMTSDYSILLFITQSLYLSACLHAC